MKRIMFLLKRINIEKLPISVSFMVLISFVLILGVSSCDKCPHDPLQPCEYSIILELVNTDGVNLLSGSEVEYYWEDIKLYKDGEAVQRFYNYPESVNWNPIEYADCGDFNNTLRYRYFLHLNEMDIDTIDFVYELKALECENAGVAYQEVYYNDSLYYQSDIDDSTIKIQIIK